MSRGDPDTLELSPGRPSSRRALGRAGLATLAAALSAGLPWAGPAKGAGGGKAPVTSIRLTPLSLPGKDRLSTVRLIVELIVRPGEAQAEEIEKVNQLKPRVMGALVEKLSQERFEDNSVTTEQVKRLKDRVRDICNEALGDPLIAEVLIISLIVT